MQGQLRLEGDRRLEGFVGTLGLATFSTFDGWHGSFRYQVDWKTWDYETLAADLCRVLRARVPPSFTWSSIDAVRTQRLEMNFACSGTGGSAIIVIDAGYPWWHLMI